MATTLAELVAQERAKQGVSLRTVAERSGGLISHGHLGTIESGAPMNVSDDKLKGIAIGLGIPLERVRRAAGVPAKDQPFVLPARASRLNQRERQAVVAVIDAILAARHAR